MYETMTSKQIPRKVIVQALVQNKNLKAAIGSLLRGPSSLPISESNKEEAINSIIEKHLERERDRGRYIT